MRLVFRLRIVFVLLATGFLVLPAAGCGAKKKGKKGSGLTIKQQLDKAETESSPDRKAAAYVKVGRSQLASSDKSGAKTSVGKAFKEVSGEGDANLFSPRLVDIAELFVAVGDKKQARKSLELATTLAVDPG
jgi:Tfp pilus assembly protein PilF